MLALASGAMPERPFLENHVAVTGLIMTGIAIFAFPVPYVSATRSLKGSPTPHALAPFLTDT